MSIPERTPERRSGEERRKEGTWWPDERPNERFGPDRRTPVDVAPEGTDFVLAQLDRAAKEAAPHNPDATLFGIAAKQIRALRARPPQGSEREAEVAVTNVLGHAIGYFVQKGSCDLQHAEDERRFRDYVSRILAALRSRPRDWKHDCQEWAMEGVACADCQEGIYEWLEGRSRPEPVEAEPVATFTLTGDHAHDAGFRLLCGGGLPRGEYVVYHAGTTPPAPQTEASEPVETNIWRLLDIPPMGEVEAQFDRRERRMADMKKWRRLERAARKVLDGLNARIEQADSHSVPVFDGITDLHDALNALPKTDDPS